MNRRQLIVEQSRYNRKRQFIGGNTLIDPGHQFSHQNLYISGFRRHIHDIIRAAISDHILVLPVWRRMMPSLHYQAMENLNLFFCDRRLLTAPNVDFVEGLKIVTDFTCIAFLSLKLSSA